MKAEITSSARAAIKPKQHEPLKGVANLLLELRTLAAMSQTEAAAAIGLTRASVTNMEAGRQPVTIEALEMLASSLGLEVVVTVQPKGSNA